MIGKELDQAYELNFSIGYDSSSDYKKSFRQSQRAPDTPAWCSSPAQILLFYFCAWENMILCDGLCLMMISQPQPSSAPL